MKPRQSKMNTVKKTLAKQIKIFRENRNLTQNGLSIACNVTCRTISNAEREMVVPALDVLLALADFFEVSLDELLGRAVPGNENLRPIERNIQDKIHLCDEKTLKHLSAYMDLLQQYV